MSTVITRHAPPSSPIAPLTSTSSDLLFAIESYKSRFRKTQKEIMRVTEMKDKMEADRENLFRANIVYTTLLDELNETGWRQLPQATQYGISSGFNKRDLATIFSRWFLEWEQAFPADYPLPPPMRHFGQTSAHFARFGSTFVFDSSGYESDLSKIIYEAWEAISDPARQLMLFCWCGLHVIRQQRNCIAHPNVNKLSAKSILDEDFHNTFENLHAAACAMTDYLFSD